MMSTVKAEFRKLLSVRSTYILTAIVVALLSFIAFYGQGYKLSPQQLMDPTLLANDILGSLSITIFGAVVAILLVTHEYRYNTIMYTLTASNSRTRVFIAKAFVVSVYALLLAVIVGLVSPLMTVLGAHAHGYTLAHQTIHFGDVIWRSLFYAWGGAMAGFIIALLVRSQVAAIAILFLVPELGEQLLRLILKNNAQYLPFTALNQVIGISSGSLTPGKAAWVFAAYLLAGSVTAWVLFLRRDAN